MMDTETDTLILSYLSNGDGFINIIKYKKCYIYDACWLQQIAPIYVINNNKTINTILLMLHKFNHAEYRILLDQIEACIW